MKKTDTLLTISFLLLCTNCNIDTQNLVYGSNNGKVMHILNTDIYYEEYGTGMPLLLLSGGGIDRSIRDYEKCIPELAKHYRVIAPDTPGQGRSALPDSLSYEVITEFMSQFIDSLHLDSTYVMGFSDGGIVGILLAERRPDKVRKVIASGANNGIKGAALPPGVPLDSLRPMSMSAFEKVNKALIDHYMELRPRDWKQYMRDVNKMVYAKEYFPESVYANIRIPVMLVLGDRDMVSVGHGYDMHRKIKGSQFCVLPNTSHEVFTEKPELINKIAIDFFR